MMTMDELEVAHINPHVAREAHAQADRRLADVLAIKATYEQKAFSLFSSYVTISLALFGAGRALDVLAFWVAGVFFVGGAVCFALALLDEDYGVHGSPPSMWLRRGVIDGGDRAVPTMLAYLARFHEERIKASQKGNGNKAFWVKAGIALGILGPVAILALTLGQWFNG